MKYVLSVFLSIFIQHNLTAQKIINDPNVVVRPVESFHSIEVSGGIDLYLSKGDPVVAVSAKDKANRDRIVTEVENGVLKIYYDWKDGVRFGFSDKDLKAYVSYETILSLFISFGSNIRVDGTLKASVLQLQVKGGSEFKGRVETEELNIEVSAGSDIGISGKTTRLNIEASAGSDVNGYDLESAICNVSASGGSDINLTVNKELSAEASGASDVNWKGSATVKKSKVSGASQVSHRS